MTGANGYARRMLALIPHFWELLILFAIVLLLFGNRLPSLARSLGLSITEFKKGIKELEHQSDDNKSE